MRFSKQSRIGDGCQPQYRLGDGPARFARWRALRCSLTARRPWVSAGRWPNCNARGCERLIEGDHPGDFSGDVAAVEALFTLIRKHSAGGLDVLVNNAVLQGSGFAFEVTPLEQFEQVLP